MIELTTFCNRSKHASQYTTEAVDEIGGINNSVAYETVHVEVVFCDIFVYSCDLVLCETDIKIYGGVA